MERLAGWCYDHRRRVVLLWIAALVGSGILGGAFGGKYATDFSAPDFESQKAYDLLREKFPDAAGDSAQLVVKSDSGVQEDRARIEALFAKLATVDKVKGVQNPFTDPAAQRQISRDGKVLFSDVTFTARAFTLLAPDIKKMADVTRAESKDGLQVELGGIVVQGATQETPGAEFGIGILLAILVLLVVFGSVLAMGLPLLTAIFGIGIGISLLGLLTNVLDVPIFAPGMAGMIGLGVGIDYALFIVTRYRAALHGGAEPRDATIEALTTSGRAVIFAGTTVVISVLGIMVVGFSFLQGLAVTMAVAVLVTMLASVTFVPAMLGYVRHRIDKWHVPAFHRQESDHRETFWYRWSHRIARRPATYAIASLVVLVTLSLPVLGMTFGFSDAGNEPKTSTARRAYDLLAEGFGPGFNAPFVVVAPLTGGTNQAGLESFVADVAKDPGVADVSPVIRNQSNDTAIVTVVPASSPQDAKTNALAHRVRDIAKSHDVTAYVGGFIAFNVDFADRLSERLPVLMAAVIVLSFLLLMVVFRSLLVPLKAAIMNLLSIGAAYGFVVAVFQWGWLSDVFGIGQPAPIEAWVPMMLFAILFGLSMDYEVFLLSRIREEYDRNGGNNREAVADGLATTARVITAAALIMILVFAAFALGGQRQLKLFGLGLAVAILVDATIVRMVLVPATMELLGNANWWLPRWLDRLLPKVRIDQSAAATTEDAALEPAG